VVIPFARVIEGERAGWRSLSGGGLAVLGAITLAITR
jgi:drug/metabolite transporter (DMT)-like permease